MKKILLFITTLLITTACTNSDLYQFGESESLNKNLSKSNCKTRCHSGETYLDLQGKPFAEWDSTDYSIYFEAIDRVGVYVDGNRHHFVSPDGVTVNISESLYREIIEQFERSNSILAEMEKVQKLPRRIPQNKEGSQNELPDCMIIAVSRMGVNAPSYSIAKACCDSIQPNWRATGGLLDQYILPFISTFASVEQVCPESLSNNSSYNQLNNCVIRFYQVQTGLKHAGNATAYSNSYFTYVDTREDNKKGNSIHPQIRN